MIVSEEILFTDSDDPLFLQDICPVQLNLGFESFVFDPS